MSEHEHDTRRIRRLAYENRSGDEKDHENEQPPYGQSVHGTEFIKHPFTRRTPAVKEVSPHTHCNCPLCGRFRTRVDMEYNTADIKSGKIFFNFL
jgi:hypothetical protein